MDFEKNPNQENKNETTDKDKEGISSEIIDRGRRAFESEGFKGGLNEMNIVIEEKRKELDEMENGIDNSLIAESDQEILKIRLDTIKDRISELESLVERIKKGGDLVGLCGARFTSDIKSVSKFISNSMETGKSEKE